MKVDAKLPGAAGIRVLLDGVAVDHVCEADDVAGVIVVEKVDDDGLPLVDREKKAIIQETLHGRVELLWMRTVQEMNEMKPFWAEAGPMTIRMPWKLQCRDCECDYLEGDCCPCDFTPEGRAFWGRSGRARSVNTQGLSSDSSETPRSTNR